MSLRAALLLLQVSTGIGAIGGGLLLVLRPDGSLLQLPLDFLTGSIFEDYLLPGITLFAVIGMGNITGAMVTLRNAPFMGFSAIGLGAAMLVWMAVQLHVVGFTHWLQTVYVLVGFAEIILGYRLSIRQAGPVRLN